MSSQGSLVRGIVLHRWCYNESDPATGLVRLEFAVPGSFGAGCAARCPDHALFRRRRCTCTPQVRRPSARRTRRQGRPSRGHRDLGWRNHTNRKRRQRGRGRQPRSSLRQKIPASRPRNNIRPRGVNEIRGSPPARALSVGGIRAGSFSVCQLLAALARTAIFCPAVSRISMVSTSSMVTGVAPVTLARPWAVAFQLAARS